MELYLASDDIIISFEIKGSLHPQLVIDELLSSQFSWQISPESNLEHVIEYDIVAQNTKLDVNIIKVYLELKWLILLEFFVEDRQLFNEIARRQLDICPVE